MSLCSFMRRLVTRRRLLAAAASAGSLLLLWIVVSVAAWLTPLPARLSERHSTFVEFRDGSPAYVFLSPDQRWRIAAVLDELDPAFVQALLAFEDRRFHAHLGVDPVAVARAAVQNLRSGRVVSGASTITMQLVRVLEPRPRTLRSKVVEAFRAYQLELKLTKREILTAYLTFAPYGRNLEGVEAASLAYFGHRPTELTAAEIATLLAVPQAPNERYPAPNHAKRLQAGRDDIAARLDADGALPRGKGDAAVSGHELLAQVRATPVPTELRAFPRLAPHAAAWAKARLPGRDRIRLTLDRGAQLLAERLMRSARSDALRRGAHNGALVVVDHARAEVAALVGNFDFWDEENGGQIAGFAQPRSPGSALKPFLYAMGVDRGLTLPEFLVPDIPVQYGNWSPRNFDGNFSGLVRMEEALSLSLNIPFVNLLAEIGSDRFIATLRAMGASSLSDQPGRYGLTAVIGGVELTPLELAGLYAALANQGRYRPVRAFEEEAPVAEVEAFSPGATYLTVRALSRRDRPDFPARAEVSGSALRIHWKTGTSFGHRDAWAAGSGPRYTAVVWVGNFNGKPSPEIAGAEAAGPLLFDALEALEDRTAPLPAAGPTRDLKEVEVCAFSGHPATEACPTRRAALARVTSVPTAKCPFHVLVDVDEESGLSLTPTCRGDRSWKPRSFVSLPAAVARWLGDQQRQYPRPPRLAPGCEAASADVPPRIASPLPGQAAVLIPGVPPEDQEIPLEAEAAAGARLSWFVDGEFLASAAADERVWWTPRPGRHEIVVTDESGASARRTLTVTSR